MFDLITIGDSGGFQGKWVLLQLEAAVLARPPTTLSFIPNAHYEGPEGHYLRVFGGPRRGPYHKTLVCRFYIGLRHFQKLPNDVVSGFSWVYGWDRLGPRIPKFLFFKSYIIVVV